ncbi:MAG: zf-HC2 domain-containing protein [Oscillospiraceae bacterium]|nr:zf-HC2 domain-containing protein [Oscillospiraceae bacterium]
MKISCDVISDLLPLYHDGVCNEASRKLVEEHLAECDTCVAMLAKLNDNRIDNQISAEREDVVQHHAKAVKRKSLVVGTIIASILMIPVLTTFIVNLATAGALDWFFIVITSLMVFASVTVVPLVVEKNKGIWTLGSFTGSLLLLFLTINIFNNQSWFFIATIPTIFGLSIFFSPYVIRKLPLTGFASHHKGLLTMAVNTILLYATIIVSGLFTGGSAEYWRVSLLITSACLIYPWALFLIIRYIRTNKLVRAGICVFISGIFLAIVEDIVMWVLYGTWQSIITSANPFSWDVHMINANVNLLTLLVCCAVGGALTAIGLSRRNRN